MNPFRLRVLIVSREISGIESIWRKFGKVKLVTDCRSKVIQSHDKQQTKFCVFPLM